MVVLIISLLCIVWTILTIPYQFDTEFSKNIARYDRLGLIPRWTFFAPNPGKIDIHLLVRFGKGDERISEWEEIFFIEEHKRDSIIMRSIFNTNRRFEKMLFDFVNDVRLLKKQISQIRHSSEYILLLSFTESLAIQRQADEVQFMLVGSNITLLDDIEIIFTSDLHKIRENS